MNTELLPVRLTYPATVAGLQVPFKVRFEIDFLRQVQGDAFDLFFRHMLHTLDDLIRVDLVEAAEGIGIRAEIGVGPRTDIENTMCTLASIIEAEFGVAVISERIEGSWHASGNGEESA